MVMLECAVAMHDRPVCHIRQCEEKEHFERKTVCAGYTYPKPPNLIENQWGVKVKQFISIIAAVGNYAK